MLWLNETSMVTSMVPSANKLETAVLFPVELLHALLYEDRREGGFAELEKMAK